jgi:exodeoxyribonuclease VII small subunit
MSKSNDLVFEDALAQMEEIVKKLESGTLPLEEALALYERGQQLSAYCSSKLDQAELKIQQLAGGQLTPLTLDEAA